MPHPVIFVKSRVLVLLTRSSKKYCVFLLVVVGFLAIHQLTYRFQRWTLRGLEKQSNTHLIVVYPRYSRALVDKLLEAVDLRENSTSAVGRISFFEGLSSCRLPDVLGAELAGQSIRLLFVLPDPLELVVGFYVHHRASLKGLHQAASTPATPNEYWLRDYVAEQSAVYDSSCDNVSAPNPKRAAESLSSSTGGSQGACCPLTSRNALLEGLYVQHIERWKAAFLRSSSHLSVLVLHYHDVLRSTKGVAERMSVFFATNVSSSAIIPYLNRLSRPLVQVGRGSSLQLMSIPVVLKSNELDLATQSKLTGFFERHNSSWLSVRQKLKLAAMNMTHWKEQLRLVAFRLAVNNTLVVTFCEKTYLSVLVNWLAFVRTRSRSQVSVLVITTDRAFSEFLSRKGVNSLYLSAVPSSNLAASFWKTRLHVFTWLSAWNFTVIHSDLDAIWLKNPLPEIYSHLGKGAGHGRLLLSRDIYPGEQLRVWGSTLCTGFMAFRGGNRTGTHVQSVMMLPDSEN